jgi:Ribbon-helix-helix protein, copG family.
METMPNITLSMDKDNQKKLREIAQKERRSISKQVIVMMEQYIENQK